MFSNIFQFEWRFWLRQPMTYLSASIFFAVSFLTMWGMASEGGDSGQEQWVNSSWQLLRMANLFSILLVFLLPSFIGRSIYRDFRHEAHRLLYSFPIQKSSYLAAKFGSAFVVVLGIAALIGLGFLLATFLPGTDPLRLGPFRWQAYVQLYGLFLLPNLCLFSALVFAVVSFSRNVYAGFITVLVLIVVQGLGGSLLAGWADGYWQALLDPFGLEAVKYEIRYWTLAERNEQLLPMTGVIAYNRLLWLGVATGMGVWAYRYFDFRQLSYWAGRSKGKAEDTRGWTNVVSDIRRVNIPAASLDFSWPQQLANTWSMAVWHFRSIVSSWAFLSILLAGFLFVFFQQAEMNPQYDFGLRPVTWKMLEVPTFVYAGLINMLTFLYAGVLVHREKTAGMSQLVDATAAPTALFVLSKLLALVLMQVLLLSFLLLGGVIVQWSQGFYDFQLGHYFFDLYVLNLWHYFLWALMAIFVHSLLQNLYVGVFLLLLVPAGMITIGQLGPLVGLDFLEQAVFRYNQTPGNVAGFAYSDLAGYETLLSSYFIYKSYWLLGGLCLLMLARLFWARGYETNWRQRVRLARQAFRGRIAWTFGLLLLGFLGMGAGIFYENNVLYQRINSQADQDALRAAYERKYGAFEYMPQPRISSVYVEMDIYPRARNFQAKGRYLLRNLCQQPIDTLLINYSYNEHCIHRIDWPHHSLQRDTQLRLDQYALSKPLLPGDSLHLHFELNNEPSSLMRNYSKALPNGCFIGRSAFPLLGYKDVALRSAAKRKKYGLPKRTEDLPLPSDSSSLGYEYSGNDSGMIDFEAIVSTNADQVPVSSGDFQRTWESKGRRYAHYKSSHPIELAFSFHSGHYHVHRDQWKDVALEVHHHPSHTYNLESLVDGLKASMAYCSEQFAPFQHKEVRIAEYAKSQGTFATLSGNCMPYSELYFIAKVEEDDPDAIDFPFYVSAHEMAHQWWGIQVNPANVQGGKMLTESLAEYVALKVLERTHGKEQMRKFLRYDLDIYLKGRGTSSRPESPLLYCHPDEEYIAYQKGALVFYALSDYLGEDKLNAVLRKFLLKHRFGEAPFPSSLDLLNEIRPIVPDSLSYLVRDLFESVTLYDNQMQKVEVEPLPNGAYEVILDFRVQKYRMGADGKPRYEDQAGEALGVLEADSRDSLYSLPLADYIDIGVLGGVDEQGKPKLLYLKKHRINRIHNRLRIEVPDLPTEVGIDLYNKLIDRGIDDNRMDYVSQSTMK
ncbi:MAG: ABC transporter permease [Bacteroidota bacterium]